MSDYYYSPEIYHLIGEFAVHRYTGIIVHMPCDTECKRFHERQGYNYHHSNIGRCYNILIPLMARTISESIDSIERYNKYGR